MVGTIVYYSIVTGNPVNVPKKNPVHMTKQGIRGMFHDEGFFTLEPADTLLTASVPIASSASTPGTYIDNFDNPRYQKITNNIFKPNI